MKDDRSWSHFPLARLPRRAAVALGRQHFAHPTHVQQPAPALPPGATEERLTRSESFSPVVATLCLMRFCPTPRGISVSGSVGGSSWRFRLPGRTLVTVLRVATGTGLMRRKLTGG